MSKQTPPSTQAKGNGNDQRSLSTYGRSGARGRRGGCRGRGGDRDKRITNSNMLVGQVKTGIMRDIVITSSGNRAVQYKNFDKGLQVYASQKDYHGLDEILRTKEDWNKKLLSRNTKW